MPRKRSNLNNQYSRAARRERLERANRSEEQTAQINEEQRIRAEERRRANIKAAAASRLYRERHREKINQRRREIRRHQKNSYQIHTQNINEIEQVTHATSNNLKVLKDFESDTILLNRNISNSDDDQVTKTKPKVNGNQSASCSEMFNTCLHYGIQSTDSNQSIADEQESESNDEKYHGVKIESIYSVEEQMMFESDPPVQSHIYPRSPELNSNVNIKIEPSNNFCILEVQEWIPPRTENTHDNSNSTDDENNQIQNHCTLQENILENNSAVIHESSLTDATMRASLVQINKESDENNDNLKLANKAFGVFVGHELGNVPLHMRRSVMYNILQLLDSSTIRK